MTARAYQAEETKLENWNTKERLKKNTLFVIFTLYICISDLASCQKIKRFEAVLWQTPPSKGGKGDLKLKIQILWMRATFRVAIFLIFIGEVWDL